jgi:integrase
MTLLKILRYAELPYTVHGFRSAFRDWAAEQTSYPGEVAEAALAHSVANRVEAAYRRTNYLDKRRVLMADWGAFCTTVGREEDERQAPDGSEAETL